MSAGHYHHKHGLTRSELDDLLDEALANAKIKARLAKSFKLDTGHDIPLLGSSSVGGGTVYIDRHLRHGHLPFGFLMVDGRQLNTKHGLIRHERLESACEDILGWPYKIAHPVAQHFEERDYSWRGFNPKEVEAAFSPYIRADEREPLKKVPVDLDLRPMLYDAKLLERTRAAQDAQKKPHETVGYVDKSSKPNQQCMSCVMFVKERFAGPACTLVKGKIDPRGWCRRYFRGSLENS